MKSNNNLSQKSSKILSSSRHKMNRLNQSSESNLEMYKRENVRYGRLNTTSKEGKFRLNTELKEGNVSLDGNGRKKTHSLLLADKISSLKEGKFLKLNDSSNDINLITTQRQPTLLSNPHPKPQPQWVNSVLPTQSAQALYQQNHQLKKQNNHLKQQNSRLLSRINIEKKEKENLAKQLSLQNEYYNFYQRFDIFGSTTGEQAFSKAKAKPKINNKYGFHPVNYMITGIKFRYDKLKSDYELKCKELQEVLKITQYTDISEVLSHSRTLEKENVRLVKKITQLSQLFFEEKQKANDTQTSILNDEQCFKSSKFFKINTEQSDSSLADSKIDEVNSQYIKNLIQARNQLTETNFQLSQANAHLQTKIDEIAQEMRQKTASMKNMHKSLTLLDNELYHQKKENRQILKIQKEIETKLTALQNQNAKIKLQCQKEIQNIKTLTEKMFEAEKKIFLKEIQQKNQKISKHQKQISYLSALLKYWKPLDKDDNNLYARESSKYETHDQQESSVLKSSMIITSNRKRTKTKISQNEKSTEEFKLGLKEPVLSDDQNVIQDGDQFESEQDQNQPRLPKTSRTKHTNGFRARKVNPFEIEYLKDQIKYRCMTKRLSMHQIRQFFQVKPQRLQNLSKKQQKWKNKYVTMRELKQILMETPFCLTKDEAYKFSRFIVEDTSAEHVYCDQENQIEREIVKSIIKAFIGEYNLPDLEECRSELQNLLKNYGVNLKRALDTLSDKGEISPEKLFELIDSLGIGMTDQLKSQIMTRLYQKSETRSLSLLKYEPMFEQNFM